MAMSRKTAITIGIIGLDSSHCVEFTKLLNDPEHPRHVAGARVIAAYPGGSDDFELSYSRVGKFTGQMRDQWQVEIFDAPEAVAALCDAILLLSSDGRAHLPQFRRIAGYGKPVFIDKPLAVSALEAQEIYALARRHGMPVMSSSAYRYVEPLAGILADETNGNLLGVDCFGPMPLQPTQPGLFWYGIHAVEMLYTALGPGCRKVTALSAGGQEIVVGEWGDGRIGTIRGDHVNERGFGLLLHWKQKSEFIPLPQDRQARYHHLLKRIMVMFAEGRSDVEPGETLEIMRFIEAANASGKTGQTAHLSQSGGWRI